MLVFLKTSQVMSIYSQGWGLPTVGLTLYRVFMVLRPQSHFLRRWWSCYDGPVSLGKKANWVSSLQGLSAPLIC